jgi:hypothetical protein
MQHAQVAPAATCPALPGRAGIRGVFRGAEVSLGSPVGRQKDEQHRLS